MIASRRGRGGCSRRARTGEARRRARARAHADRQRRRRDPRRRRAEAARRARDRRAPRSPRHGRRHERARSQGHRAAQRRRRQRVRRRGAARGRARARARARPSCSATSTSSRSPARRRATSARRTSSQHAADARTRSSRCSTSTWSAACGANQLHVNGGESAKEWKRARRAGVRERGACRCTVGGSGYGPSDHMAFYVAGIPVLFFFTGNHLDYHTATDDADKINAAGGARVALIVADIAAAVASAQGRADVRQGAAARPSGGDMRRRGASLGTVPSYSEDPNQPPGVVLSDVMPGRSRAEGRPQGRRSHRPGRHRRDPEHQRPDVRAADREARHRREGHVRARRQGADGERDLRRAEEPQVSARSRSRAVHVTVMSRSLGRARRTVPCQQHDRRSHSSRCSAPLPAVTTAPL